MEKRQAPTKAVIEYEGVDLPPVYVEAAQGMNTPKGSLQMSFFSEYMKPRENLGATIASVGEPAGTAETMRIQTEEPYGLDKGSIRIVRRIEANLILPLPFLRQLVPWLQERLNDLEQTNRVPK